MQGCALAMCSHEAQQNRFLQSLVTLGTTQMYVTMISECKCDCVPFQLQNNLAWARPSLKAGDSTRTLCLNCVLPLNSNTQTRYLILNRKRHLYCVLQVLPVHVYGYFLKIRFLLLGGRLEWGGELCLGSGFWHVVCGVFGSKVKDDLRHGWRETCGNCSFSSLLGIICKYSLQ